LIRFDLEERTSMIVRKTRRIWALALGLAVTGWGIRAEAASIPYTTYGTIATPSGSPSPNPVYYNGTSGMFDPTTGTITLGAFEVSSLTNTTNLTYSNTPFQIIVGSGGTQAESISGILNGSLGPNATANPYTNASGPWLYATVSSVNPYGSDPLPFTMNVPLNTRLPIQTANGAAGPTATQFTVAAGPAPPIPEPASIMVFTVAIGGLGLWRRRAGR
jgi:hypothetical protein